jgi:hypothetical protein
MTIFEIRRAKRQELIAFLESWGTACYSDDKIADLRACAFEIVRGEQAERKRKEAANAPMARWPGGIG